MSRDPRTMACEELVQEIHTLREDMERTASRMVELAQSLYSKVRRSPSDEYTSRYITFANAWTRFGSMVDGGIRRTAGVTRLVSTIQREQQEAREEAERKEQLRSARVSAEAKPTVQPDLVELYGEEMVTRATR